MAQNQTPFVLMTWAQNKTLNILETSATLWPKFYSAGTTALFPMAQLPTSPPTSLQVKLKPFTATGYAQG